MLAVRLITESVAVAQISRKSCCLVKTENGAALYARMKVVENIQGQTLQEIADSIFWHPKARLSVMAIEAI